MSAHFRSEAQRTAIETQAARWVVWLDGADADCSRAELNGWLNADPMHAVAFAAAEDSWHKAARSRVRDTHQETESPEEDEPPAARGYGRRAAIGGMLAASAVLAVATGLRLANGKTRQATSLGQRGAARLADGSSISLNTDTQIDIALDTTSRRVTLLRGEAMFDVARDVSRPFIVDLGTAKVEVLGTQFNIRQRDDGFELSVKEGLVAVSSSDHEQIQVPAGSTALIRPGLLAVTGSDPGLVRQRTAWTDGVLEFNDEPLEQAVDEFNRYRRDKLVIGDPRIATVPVAGRFGIDDRDMFVRALASSFDIKAVRASDGSTILMQQDGNLATTTPAGGY